MSRRLAIGLLLIAVAAGVWLLARPRAARVPTQDEVLAAVIARVDEDHDGRISRDEWRRYGGEADLFARYDADRNGFLDVAEFRAMFFETDPIRLNGR